MPVFGTNLGMTPPKGGNMPLFRVKMAPRITLTPVNLPMKKGQIMVYRSFIGDLSGKGSFIGVYRPFIEVYRPL